MSMMESATVSTTTIAVAADRPPRKAMNVKMWLWAWSGSARRYMSCGYVISKHKAPGHRYGHDENIDGDQIEGKEPRGLAKLFVGDVLDERHVKLPRKQNDTDETEQGDGQKNATVDSGIEDICDVRLVSSPSRSACPDPRSCRTRRICRPEERRKS